MTLMRNKEVIIRAKKNWNLFTLNLAQLERAMTVINKRPKVIAITEQGRPTHLVSQKKRIQLWDR